MRQFLLPSHKLSPVYCVVIFQGSRMGEWVIFSTECLKSVPCVRCRGRPYLAQHSTPLPPSLSNRVTLGQGTPTPDSSKYFLLLTICTFLIPVTRNMSDSWIRNIETGVFWLELCIIVACDVMLLRTRVASKIF